MDTEDNLSNLVHLDGKCQIMWHNNYYDGPLSGVILYNDEIHYFSMVDEYEPTPEDMKRWNEAEDDDDDDFDFHRWYRKHGVYQLSDDDKIRVVTLHGLWQSHVGIHSDYWPINGRALHPRREEERKVPGLHYGPSGDRETAWNEYQALREHWEAKHGKFTHEGKTPIGFIYHDQLYGRIVDANGELVQNDDSV